MGYNQSLTTDNAENIGSHGYKSENKKIPGKIILVPKGDSIDTEANAKLVATYNGNIKGTTGRWYVTPPITEIEDMTSDSTVVDFPNGDKRTISLGNYGFAMYFDVPDAVIATLPSLNNKQWDAYIVWLGGFVEGRKDSSGVIFYPKRVKEFIIDRRTIPDGSTVQRVKAVITFDEKSDMEENTIFVEPTAFDPMDLDSLRDVTLTIADGSVTKHADVTVKDDLGEGVEGLVSADFDDTGGTPNISAVTDNGGGSYDITYDAAGDCYVNLVAAASISIDDYIESTGAQNATIT